MKYPFAKVKPNKTNIWEIFKVTEKRYTELLDAIHKLSDSKEAQNKTHAQVFELFMMSEPQTENEVYLACFVFGAQFGKDIVLSEIKEVAEKTIQELRLHLATQKRPGGDYYEAQKKHLAN